MPHYVRCTDAICACGCTCWCGCPPRPQIHWLSILNSVILVVLLTSFLFIILMRVLRNDYARYSAVEADPEDGPSAHGRTTIVWAHLAYIA